MANYVSIPTGSAASMISNASWYNVEAGTRGVQAAYSASTNTTTSMVFNAGAQDATGTNGKNCIGILLYCKNLTSTGTVTVCLSEDSGTTETKTLAVNATDLPTNPSWVFFKWASVLALDGGTDYAIGVKGSSNANAAFYRDATAANWSHLIVYDDSPAGAPTTGDNFYVVGMQTGTAAETTAIITMDETAATDYGLVHVGNIGTFAYDTTAAHNPYLRLSGSLIVHGDATFTMGTIGDEIPRDSVAILEFDCASDSQYVFNGLIGSTVTIQGLSRTTGKNVVSCLLNTDEAVNSTSLGVDTDTGWLNNDSIVVASTTRTYNQTEKGLLNGNANAADITVDGFGGAGGGLANAHSGTATTQAEVILLTRNIVIRNVTTSASFYFYVNGTSDIDWAEFAYCTQFYQAGTGCDTRYCSFHDSEGQGVQIATGTFSYNVLYNLNTNRATSQVAFYIPGGTPIVTYNIFLLLNQYGNTDVGALWIAGNPTFNYNTIAACYTPNGMALNYTSSSTDVTWDNINCHSNNASGLEFGVQSTGTNQRIKLTNLKCWRNSINGIMIWSPATTFDGGYAPINTTFYIEDSSILGNATSGIKIGDVSSFQKMVIKNSTISAEASYSQTSGIACGNYTSSDIYLVDVDFGTTTAHTQDILLPTVDGMYKIHAWSCNFASTEVTNQTKIGDSSFIKSQWHDDSSTSFKNYYRNGTIVNDDATRHTASGYSWKMTPNNATYKLIIPGPTEFDTFKAYVTSGTAVTVTAYVLYDGTYNGNMPRLVVVGDLLPGITTDQTDSAASANSNNWDLLSVAAGTPTVSGFIEFYIDCDGTAGNVYVDDIAITQP